MKGYKVFYQSKGGKLTSCTTYGKALKVYRIGKWNMAPKWLRKQGYHLTFFKTLEDAKTFLAELTYFIILSSDRAKPRIDYLLRRVEVQGVRYELPSQAHISDLAFGNILPQSITFWPTGTAMAGKIKVDKE